MAKKTLTINDIARLSGVSKKSVSRVLNDEHGVSEDTRSRIKAVMSEYGYQPNRRARALAANRSFLLAFVYNNPNSAYVQLLLSGVLRLANGRGYEVLVHAMDNPAPDDAGQQILQFFQRAGCDGLILSPPLSESLSVITAIEGAGISAVRLAGDQMPAQMPQISFDDREAALRMTRHLIERGATRFAFLGGPEQSAPTKRRLSGYRDALVANGLSPAEFVEVYGDFSFRSGLILGQELLASDARPDCFVCCNDEMAAGVIHAVSQAGLSVPGDVLVSGFDDAPIAQEILPPLSTVRQPIEAMGEASVLALLSLIDGSSAPSETAQRRFTPELIFRDSTAQRTEG